MLKRGGAVFETFFSGEFMSFFFITTLSSEHTKNHPISPLKYVISPLKIKILTKIPRAFFTKSRLNFI